MRTRSSTCHIRRGLWPVLSLAACGIAGRSAWAQTDNWTNPTVGNWYIGGNWSPDIPDSSHIAEIDDNGLAFIDSGAAVADFLYLGFGSGQTGFLQVTGPGTLTLGAILNVARGSLQISSGGRLVVLNDPNIGNSTEIGENGNGTIIVTGANSYLSAGYTKIATGSSSAATLRIEGGGRVDSSQVFLGQAGSGGAIASVNGTNSLWSISNSLQVGQNGVASNLTVSSHGTVNAPYTTIWGNGNVTVTGLGSSFNNTSSSGTLEVGYLGAGVLNVQANGVVNGANGCVADGGTATAIVTGAGSAWNNSANLSIGGGVSNSASATGTLTVSSGGAVTSASATLALRANGIGTATVTGIGSKWTITGDNAIGQAGTGTLAIRDGGKVSNAKGYLGLLAGARGTVIVSDPGSSWTGGGSFFVGNDGIGTLQVLNGGTAGTAGNSYLGFDTGASGDADVSGAGSVWNVAVGLVIGGNFAASGGAGHLKIENGGAVNTGTTLLYSTGSIELSGSTTYTGTITAMGGLMYTNGDTALANAIVLSTGGFGVYNNTPGSNSTFSGTISGANDFYKFGVNGVTGRGMLTLAASNTYTGMTTINSGTLRVTGSIAASSQVKIAGGTFDAAATQRVKILSVGNVGAAVVSSGVLTVGDNVTASPLKLTANGSIGGRLDVMSNAVCLDYIPGNAATDSAQLAAIRSQIIAAYNGGGWNGPGIFTSAAAAEPNKALGYALATEVPGVVGGQFLGKTGIDASSVLVWLTLAGDSDLSGTVDSTDFVALAKNFNATGARWTQGDFNYDGLVNALDFNALAINYGGPHTTGPIASLVPEPLLGPAVLICVAGLSRRRREHLAIGPR